MRTIRAAAVVAVTICLLAGCATEKDPAGASSDSSATPVPAVLGTVSGVDELHGAYAKASGTCSGELENRNVVTVALSSGTCPETGTVLTAYVDHPSAVTAADNLGKLSGHAGIGSILILGDNWLINPSGTDKDLVDEVAEKLGGQVIRVEPTVTTSAAPSAANAPGPGIATTGNFAADLESATGIVPDDAESYEDYLAGYLCDPTLELNGSGQTLETYVRRFGDDQVGSGHHPDAVRLVMAYNCPERADAAEAFLADIEP